MTSRTGSILILAATVTSACAAEAPHFSRDVLPLLSENCLACHGQDEKQRKGGLRLDTHEGATAVNDGVAAIVPGKPKQSELLARIVSDDPDEIMPPPKSHKKKLTAEQVAMLTRWIEAGAPWGKHWAFEKPEKAPLPQRDADIPVRKIPNPADKSVRVTHAVDAFVTARLAKEGLTMAKEAPRHTLARRVAFDLTGLPPSPVALAVFEKDTAPGAYERHVDSLLASLITDLKRRGLLDDTLVIWGGEFGRGVAGQGKWDSPEAGRDHHPRCFTMWMAGGGVKPGITYGATDDFSYNVVKDPVHVHDFHATVLHLLGIDHERLTFRHQGLDFRLTGVEPCKVVKGIIA